MQSVENDVDGKRKRNWQLRYSTFFTGRVAEKPQSGLKGSLILKETTAGLILNHPVSGPGSMYTFTKRKREAEIEFSKAVGKK
ncbi:hypothetical protein RCO48_22900 [Peribacillus frigoritolerans]|nr:hypothetical protein [Peribacillus frigoritolerans]